MNFNNIYLNDDLSFSIYNFLNFKGRINFMQINRYTRDTFLSSLKNHIYIYINEDYLKFKLFLDNMKYTKYELKNISLILAKEINYVYHFSLFFEEEFKKYDLRYLFELIYKDININDKEFVNSLKYPNIIDTIHELKRCISWSRELTIFNIINHPNLYSLHPDFNGYFKNDKYWCKLKV